MHVLGNPKFFGLVYVVYVSFSCFVFVCTYMHYALHSPVYVKTSCLCFFYAAGAGGA